jgi:hypothetical protein
MPKTYLPIIKTTALLLCLTIIGLLVFLTACKKPGVQADVDSAISQEKYQFIALLNNDGKWTYPQVPGIPDWYFQTTGISIRPTTPEAYKNEAAYMNAHNEALYQTLKTQGKFHVVEENIARVKENLEKYKAASQQQSETNLNGAKN